MRHGLPTPFRRLTAALSLLSCLVLSTAEADSGARLTRPTFQPATGAPVNEVNPSDPHYYQPPAYQGAPALPYAAPPSAPSAAPVAQPVYPNLDTSVPVAQPVTVYPTPVPNQAAPYGTPTQGVPGLVTQVQGRSGQATEERPGFIQPAQPTTGQPATGQPSAPYPTPAPAYPPNYGNYAPQQQNAVPGLVTQVQGRTNAPNTLNPQQPSAYPTPSGVYITPTNQPTIQYARPTTPAPSTAATPVINRFSLEHTFRTLASRRQPVNVNVWFPGVTAPGNREIALGSAIIQGIALRCGDSPIIASSVPAIVPGRFNVVVGLPHELRGMVGAGDIPPTAHGQLILRQANHQANSQLLIITGNSEAGISSAILSIGLAREPLPGVPTASIRDVVLPHAPPFMRREPVRGDAIHTLEYLYANGTGIFRTANGGLRIEFNLPGDFDSGLSGDFIFELHTSAPNHQVSYNDRITARVNQQPEQISVPMGIAAAGSGHIAPGQFTPQAQQSVQTTRTTVAVPVKSFRIGQNTIEFNFPGSTSRGFEIYRDSTVATPRCTTPPTLPNLVLFNRTGYPFIGQPDGSEILVLLAGRSSETIDSTWTFLAKVAQVSNTMFHAAEYATTADAQPTAPNGRHVVLIGNRQNLPPAQRKELPEDLFREVVRLPEEKEIVEGVNLKDLLDKGREAITERVKPTPTPTPVPVRQPVYPKEERGFLGCYPPKENEHGWILLLTAETESLLRDRTAQLVLDPFWNQIIGSSVHWNQLPTTLEIYKPTPGPQTPLLALQGGDEWVEMPFGERISTRNWFAGLAITLLILILSLIKSLQKNNNLRDYSA